MIIDLTKLNQTGSIIIDETLTYDKECYKNTSIKELKPVKVSGKIFYNISDEIELDVDVEGMMILEDSITLDPIEYPYSFNINEIVNETNDEIKEYYQNSKNTLDIMPILWQNIVLEVPLRYSVVEDIEKYQGDGWKLVSDEELELKNNPFSALQKNMDGSD